MPTSKWIALAFKFPLHTTSPSLRFQDDEHALLRYKLFIPTQLVARNTPEGRQATQTLLQIAYLGANNF